jgi:hypothetical protein
MHDVGLVFRTEGNEGNEVFGKRFNCCLLLARGAKAVGRYRDDPDFSVPSLPAAACSALALRYLRYLLFKAFCFGLEERWCFVNERELRGFEQKATKKICRDRAYMSPQQALCSLFVTFVSFCSSLVCTWQYKP